MPQASHRTSVRGPTFIRLLARLTEADVRPSRQSPSDRLGQWLDWTHAVALSTALDGQPPDSAVDVPAFGGAEEAECARMRRSLVDTIAGDGLFATTRQRGSDLAPSSEEDAPEPVDYAVFRQRYLAIQRSMQAATGALRGRLRDMLANADAGLARLAEVDALMERVLSPREQALLSRVPALLGERFERLREAGQNPPVDAPSVLSATARSGAWLNVFHQDAQGLLLAELDVRFHPVEGLLAALRTHSSRQHDQKSA